MEQRMSVTISRVAVIGAGLVGSSWAVVFARAGLRVGVYDADAAQLLRAAAAIRRSLEELHAAALLRDSVAANLDRLSFVHTLDAALADAEYAQESIVESLPAKRALFAAMDDIAAPTTILASSTSAFVTSSFAEGFTGSDRCVVVHPVNPPHLVPFVEVSGAHFTRADVVARSLALMRQVGQSAIHVRKEIRGFVLNRLQWTLLAEAYRLVSEGVATADEVDRAVRDGLGRRWAFMGPFEVGDLNAPEGIADYLQRFGSTIEAISESRQGQPLRLQPTLNDALQSEARAMWPQTRRAERLAERDRRLLKLAVLDTSNQNLQR